MSCYRDKIKTGDLLAWSHYRSDKTSIWLNMVRFGTMSEYGHVSVAWRKGEELFHVEAAVPRIRISKISPDESFYCVPLSRYLPDNYDMSFFDDKVGLKYSLMDAFRAYVGSSVRDDDRWQCAELSRAYYNSYDLNFNDRAVTPARLVKAAMSRCETPLIRVGAINKPNN